ncbi:putative prophage exported protein [Escherichia coli 2-011-08_S1_C2]|nr:putative prophage exported protein [Escherichia coli 2-011-08_S1_C2]
MMLLPVGCSDINRAGQLFDAAAQVCRIIDGIRQCSQN